MDTVKIVLSRKSAQKILDDAPEEEFRADFEPQHHELYTALELALNEVKP